MPDTLTSRLLEGIDRVFEAREHFLDEQRRQAEAAEQARREHAEAFRALTDGVVRPVMQSAGRRLRELGHDFDITEHGLLEGGAFGDDQQIRFGLSLAGRGEHAFAHAGEASLAFTTNVDEGIVTVRLRVLGRDRSAMSPYHRSYDDTRVVDPAEVTAAQVEDLLVAFLTAAVESTYPRDDA